ncbi:amino acid-binding protein [Parafrankia soli]|uniref:Amino acid-binding protein n=1 Tax=Parafrankia soli TaxID=2599596 RepID=A0A1S1R2I2_9ACTN|nr:ABC transporter substrate-binding protein [Parafrankia soli]OHV40390.1 amino acid-binding protein [Parafrankia soli]
MHLGGLARRFGVVAVTAVAVAVAVTGCSAEGKGGDGSAGACDGPGVTADRVKIGFIYSDSGPGSSVLSFARAGVDARIGLANDTGGVNGRRLVYDWRDDGSSPSENAHVTEELVQDKSVFGLISATAAAGGSLDSLSAHGIPITGLANPAWVKYSNLFAYMYDVSPAVTARYIQAGGGTKAAFVMTGSPDFTVQAIERFKAAFAAVGVSTTETISYASGVDSPIQVARQIVNSGADSIVAFTAPEDLVEILQATGTAGPNFFNTVVSVTGYDRTVLRTFGPQLAGVSFSVNFHPFESQNVAMDQYRNAMARFAPESTEPEQQFALYGYLYADLFIRGLELAGDCPTREGFIESLRKVTDYDAGGLIDPVDLNANRTQPLQCNAFVRINPAGTAFDINRARLCADGSGT